MEKSTIACILHPVGILNMYQANETTLTGFWAGGNCVKTTHPGWETMLKGSYRSMALVRRYCLEFFEKNGRSVEVKEAVAMTKRGFAIFMGCFKTITCMVVRYRLAAQFLMAICNLQYAVIKPRSVAHCNIYTGFLCLC